MARLPYRILKPVRWCVRIRPRKGAEGEGKERRSWCDGIRQAVNILVGSSDLVPTSHEEITAELGADNVFRLRCYSGRLRWHLSYLSKYYANISKG